MDREANRAAMAQEMERKKQKLAELKAQNARNTLLRPVQIDNTRRETCTKEDMEKFLLEVGIGTEQTRTVPSTNNDVENIRPTTTSTVVDSTSSEIVGTRNLVLEMTEVSTVTIPVKDTVQYSKSIQTEEAVPDRLLSVGSQDFDFDNDMSMDTVRGRPRELETPLTDDLNYLCHQETAVDEKKEEPPKEFSEEEKKQILGRTDFQQFFHTASKNMERMLLGVQDKDLTDYSLDTTMYAVQNDDLLTLFHVYNESEWTENRPVVGISCGRHHKELVVVAYGADRDQPQKPPGLVCIWNTHSKMATPEYQFHSNSSIASVTFAHFHQHLILAGCYSGQIVVWDYRIVTKKTPVNKSPLTSQTHTQPVFNLSVVGNRNSHGVCSVSAAGKICFWNIENHLAQPTLSMDLHSNTSRPVATLSVSFCSDDPDVFIAASEDGKVHMFNKNTVGKHAIQATQEFAGHEGTVLAVHAHPASVHLSHLFLTAGSDWCVKLWSSKDPMLAMSFEGHDDVVVDVKWSPVHPAVFASIDLKGELLLWNLNETTENPVLTLDITKEEATLKKLAWSEDGRKLYVGDSKGNVYVYDTHENLYSVHKKEFTQFTRVLNEVKKQAEMDENREQHPLLTPIKGQPSNVAIVTSVGTLSSMK